MNNWQSTFTIHVHDYERQAGNVGYPDRRYLCLALPGMVPVSVNSHLPVYFVCGFCSHCMSVCISPVHTAVISADAKTKHCQSKFYHPLWLSLGDQPDPSLSLTHVLHCPSMNMISAEMCILKMNVKKTQKVKIQKQLCFLKGSCVARRY